MALLQNECPNIEATAKTPQLDDQTLPALYKRAKDAEATCTDYTCVYVAFQIWGSDALRKDGATGVTLRTNLAKALSTGTAVHRAGLFKKEMEKMSKRRQ